MQFVLARNPEEFLGRTEALLRGRIECNVLATVLMNVMDGHLTAAVLVYGLDERGQTRYAGLRTPPWPMLNSPLEGDADDLIELWLHADPELPGVTGPPETTRAIASAWARRTGGTVRRTMREAMHLLEEVHDPPRPARGRLRTAHAGERALLIEWMRAFAEEAGVTGASEAERMVDARLRRDGLLVWDDRGPVSFLGVTPPVAGLVRIGPVYTPPEHRRRGYAGTAVAAAGRRALGRGATGCMLFTDLTNPTSNKIYAEVGYRRTGDWEELSFDPADPLAPASSP
jgi:GNAT superfamily N-acetyltransferase